MQVSEQQFERFV